MNMRFLGLSFLLLTAPALADEVCDEFPGVHAAWSFRSPLCGPTASLTERDGYLRLKVSDGVTASGDFDSWTGTDRAPTIERRDMGSGDWTISTRIDWENVPLGTTYHAGLMFAFGEGNDVVFWGEYTGNGTVAVERTGRNLRPIYTADPGPISLQVEKIGDTYYFRHRNDDALPWIEDRVETTEMASAEPVSRVGLIVKTWGGASSPEVIADFDNFCLLVPNVELPKDPVTDPIPTLAPVSSLTCEKRPDGGLALGWSTCPGSSSGIEVRVNGETVRTLPADAVDAQIPPPLPGGSIINVAVDNGFKRPATCTLANTLVDDCDQFDEDPQSGDIWVFRTPRLVPDLGPTISIEPNPGFLRFFTPSGAAAGGHFDNWTGADFAPSLERYDMGTRDWVITTRLQFTDEIGSPPNNHHVGLMVAYGKGAPDDTFNDVTYWGQYGNQGSLRVERTGAAMTGVLPYAGAPVSLQVQKVGSSLSFSHRQDDGDPWTNDATIVMQQPYPANAGGSPPAGTPVSRVGLLIKTWGGGGSPEVTADFDYFCLKIADSPPEPAIQATPAGGVVPLEVSLSGAGSVDPSGGTLSYRWEFGDGESAAGENTRHTYTRAGLTTVSLTATDDEKNTGGARKDLYLSDNADPFQLLRLGTEGKDGLVRVDRTGARPVYCVLAGGNGITLAVDHAQFLERKLTGDWEVTAQVTSGELTPVRARAGLMARLTEDARSPNVMMSVDGQNDGYQFQFRRTVGGGTARPSPNPSITPPRGPFPAWVRLARAGTMFIGSYSTDGVTFTKYAEQDMSILGVPELIVGFAATSGDVLVNSDCCVSLSGFPEGTPPPARPTGLTARAGDGEVTLDWNDNQEAGLTGYSIHRSRAGSAFERLNAAPTASGHRDGGLDNGVEYCYRVRAVSPAGESGDSDTACATPQRSSITFRRGDTDANAAIELTDAVKLLNYLFLGQAKPECLDAADVDDSGEADISDAIANLNYQFLGAATPAPPGPFNCGPDAQAETPELGCDVPCRA